MAKFDWGFEILNKDTASRDCVAVVYDRKTETTGHVALDRYTGDGEPGQVIYLQQGFRELDAEAALSAWGWI